MTNPDLLELAENSEDAKKLVTSVFFGNEEQGPRERGIQWKAWGAKLIFKMDDGRAEELSGAVFYQQDFGNSDGITYPFVVRVPSPTKDGLFEDHVCYPDTDRDISRIDVFEQPESPAGLEDWSRPSESITDREQIELFSHVAAAIISRTGETTTFRTEDSGVIELYKVAAISPLNKEQLPFYPPQYVESL